MEDYDAYLFDWDGTLAKTLDVWLTLKRSILATYGLQAADKDIAFKMFGRVRAGALELGLPSEKVDNFVADLSEAAPARLEGAVLYADVREMLNTLKDRNKKLALITSSHKEIVDIVITQHGLLELFDIVITADDTKNHKPDPEGILFVLKNLGVEKSKALMLGDSDKDLEAATNAGVDSLLFYPKGHEVFYDQKQLLTYKPKYTISSWQELIDSLQ